MRLKSRINDTVVPLGLSTADIEAIVETFGANVESLFEAADGTSIALREKVRGMIEKIVVTPREGQEPLFMVEGDFVGIMQAAGLLSDFDPKTETALEGGASRAAVSVVAGAGFEPAAFRL